MRVTVLPEPATDASGFPAAAQLTAAHWKHEDALYPAGGSTSPSGRSAAADNVAVGDGFGWGEAALGGAGGAVALIILGSAATLLVRRRHSRFAQP
jgi:hypothetical protein